MPSCVIYPIYSTTEGFATPILPRGSHRRPTWPPHPFSSALSVGVCVSALYHQVDGAYTPLTTPRNQPHLNLMSLLGRVLVAVPLVPTYTGAKPDIDCYLALRTTAQIFKAAQCRGSATCCAHLLPWLVAGRTGERERQTASGLRQHPPATQTVKCG